MSPNITDRVAWSVGLSVGLSPSKPSKTAETIEIPFASRTLVGSGKHLLHIADRFEANTVLCAFNTVQPSSYYCFPASSNILAVVAYSKLEIKFCAKHTNINRIDRHSS